MDIIRSSVPSPFAVPVISKSLKPTASDLNEYLSLYVQRPIIPEPLRQSFNAGLGSLLLERQPNYMARPVIGPRAAIFPMNVGAPQAPYRSGLGQIETKLVIKDIALNYVHLYSVAFNYIFIYHIVLYCTILYCACATPASTRRRADP